MASFLNSIYLKQTMKKFLFLLLSGGFMMITTNAFCQQNINPEEAAAHQNDSVRVCGIVLQAKLRTVPKDKASVLFMGREETGHELNIVFPQSIRMKFSYDPEKFLVNNHVCINGRISTYNGKPAIFIYSEKQIKVDNRTNNPKTLH